MDYATIQTVIGHLKMVEDNGKLVELSFTKEELVKPKTPFLKDVQKQLNEYFSKKRKKFDIPLQLSGTPFEKDVYKALMKVPYGKTCSYKELAKLAKHDNAYRAVGQANHKNKIVIVIPCHRVINSDGSLGGYGAGTDKKRVLLDIEGTQIWVMQKRGQRDD